jgi:hypothetical protein
MQSLIALSALALSVHGNEASQQGTETEWVKAPQLGKNHFYMAQRTAGSRLLLTPNESFFPKLGLLAEGDGEFPSAGEVNGETNYKVITKWDAGDLAEWGLWIEQPGHLQIRIWMTSSGRAGRYALSLGEQKKTFSTKHTGEEPAEVATVSFTVKKSGKHLLRLACNQESKTAGTKLHFIEISGPAATHAAVLRKRWRPSAAHARFSSSHNPEQVRLCIMEMDARPGSLGFYAPITTPFGYYGPVWQADGLVGPRFNFSLWSYGRNTEEPAVEKLSHLIAIGNPEAEFSGFSHEGTGVKIRGWDPLEGRQRQRQAFAIRLEPGEIYTTYYTYFYAKDEQRWRLFGVGRTYNKRKPPQTLKVGSFVEVPGPPRVQRTGVYERRMRYRGWALDGDGNLHPFDRMSDGDINKVTGMTETDRGVSVEGWFYLQTGGWAFRKKEGKRAVELPREDTVEVDYLDPDDLIFLQTVPCEITATSVKQTASGATLSFNIRNMGQKPEVKIYWGSEEGLTFTERWENSMDVKNPREGKNSITLNANPGEKPLLVRLFLKNKEGQFWSMETLQADTK